MLYRIITEDKPHDSSAEIILQRHGIDCFTIFHAVGYWQGAKENSLVIEIDCQPIKQFTVYAAAKDIKLALNQEAVLVQTFTCESELV